MRLAAGAAMFVAFCATIYAAPTPAHAYDVTKSTNGIFINRESTDSTAGATVTIYYGYKGGETSWTATYAPSTGGSYLYSDTLTNIWASDTDGMEVPTPNGYRLMLVRLSISGGTIRNYPIVSEPLDVTVTNTHTVNVGTMPGVSLNTTAVSIADTLPVSVVELNDNLWVLAGFLALFLGSAFVVLVWGRL